MALGSLLVPADAVAALLLTHERYLDHDPGRGHPERPERLRSVLDGISSAGLSDALVPVAPRPATTAEVSLVHADAQLDLVRGASDAGGTWIDADTSTSAASYEAALLAVGAGLTAVASLEAGKRTAEHTSEL